MIYTFLRRVPPSCGVFAAAAAASSTVHFLVSLDDEGKNKIGKQEQQQQERRSSSCFPNFTTTTTRLISNTTKCEEEEHEKELLPTPSIAAPSIAASPPASRPPIFSGSKLTRKFHTNSTVDSYPNLSRHGKNCLFKKHLTPKVYQQLQDKETSSGVKLDDMIRAATTLPWGANPPRGVAGIYAGDAESYSTFSLLLDPIIEEHHRSRARRKRLQRHKTNLDPGHLERKQLDPDGRYILYTRLRLARSLKGFRFSPCIKRSERRAVENLMKECCSDWSNAPGSSGTGKYVSVMDMSNYEHENLVKRGLLPRNPDLFAAYAGTHRDWPDGRGVYLNTWDPKTLPSIMIWCNMEDHFWIISNSKGGNVQDVFSKLSSAVWALETSLQQRGHEFVEDRRLGFLNASPENIGTALRASVHVKLVRLGRLPGFEDFVRHLRMDARPEYSRSDKQYSGIFDIGNMEAFGKSEVELINLMIDGVARLIDLEKRLEEGENIDLAKERTK